LQERPEIDERVVHTGQHYDERMSQVFFDELKIPAPAHHLHIGSGSHGQQTGRMLAELESVMREESPDFVLVYGDTNSTLAAALAAAKLHISIAHVEAGLRSFNRRMPEEVNRVLTDHTSELLFCPTEVSVENLSREGAVDGVHLVGDVMYDCTVFFSQAAESVSPPLAHLELQEQKYALLTCHRAENTDDPARLAAIVRAINTLSTELPVVFPVHPRTRNALGQLGLELSENVRRMEPASYLEMLSLEKEAALVLTDSGGVQKEAFFLGTPCVTLRDETEWTETVESEANLLAGSDETQIVAAARKQLDRQHPIPDAGKIYGEGNASRRIARLLAERSITQ